ncbi:MAG: SDR family oxidoreductase [Clostridia bacterium]|nr:SDR family oxidoreductase [Clostridia bacterium]
MKRVLITGGVRGIGLATARLFDKKGYSVAVCYSSDEVSAKRAAEEGFRVIKADVSKEEDVKALFEAVGSPDVLVNNAGMGMVKLLQDTTLEEWNRVFAVNTASVYLCSKYALNGMLKRQSGVIINVSSIWGETGGSCEVAYSASKAAIIGFTKALAKEVLPSGIRVNCVTPGAIDTRMNGCFTKEELAALAEDLFDGRLGKPEEVAQAIFALSENEYITGQVLGVNGGMNI